MKAARYRFRSTWDIPAPPQAVWDELTAVPFAWDQWWPELTRVRNMNRTAELAGTSFSCTWRSHLGYRLQTEIVIDKVIPLRQVELHAAGDLSGTVICTIKAQADNSTHIDIDWQVATTKRWMNLLALLLKPLFIFSHHAVMRSGERGLKHRLAQYKNPA